MAKTNEVLRGGRSAVWKRLLLVLGMAGGGFAFLVGCSGLISALTWTSSGEVPLVVWIGPILWPIATGIGTAVGAAIGIATNTRNERRLERLMGDAPARAWSIAVMRVAGRWYTGGLWVVDDEVSFAADERGEQWRLDEITEVEVLRELGQTTGVRWQARGQPWAVRVADVHGWMRVLAG